MSSWSKWGLTRVHTVGSGDLGMKHWSLHNIAMVLFISLSTSLRCLSNKRLSSIIPRFFCGVAILLLNVKGGWESLLTFLLKITFWPCFLGYGLKLIFHWYTVCYFSEIIVKFSCRAIYIIHHRKWQSISKNCGI